MDIQYGNINILYALFIVAGVAILLVWSVRRRVRLLEQFAGATLISKLTAGVNPREHKMKAVLLLAGATFIIVGLAEPKWGYHVEQVTRRGIDIVIALDCSKSMLAEDVKPNRLGYARREIEDLIRTLEGDRVAIVAFAGTAFVQCPLTLDYGFARMALADIDTNIIPRGGTAIGVAIRKSLEAFQDPVRKYKAIVVLTDGEDHEGAVEEAAQRASDNGVKIYVVGIGEPEGTLIPVEDESGNRTYVKDKGEPVVSRLNPETLEKIASTTGGFYVHGGGAGSPLQDIYTEFIAGMEKKDLAIGEVKRYENRYQVPLAIGVVLILLQQGFIATLIDAVRWLARLKRRKMQVRVQRAAAHLRTNCVLYLFVTLLLHTALSHGETLRAKVHKGNVLYERQMYDEALKRYNEAQVDAPESPELNFNIGGATYRKQDYENAIEAYQRSLRTKDKRLEAKTNYNIGNTRFRLGEKTGNTALWQEAIEYYKRAIELDPHDTDAKFNLEFLERKIKETQNQQQKSQESQDKKEQQQEKQQGASQSKDQRQSGKEQSKRAGAPDQTQQAEPQDVRAAQREDQSQKLAEQEIFNILQEEERGAREQVRDTMTTRERPVLKDW
jgi:Ca-activated chloride channel family protein